MNVKRLIFLLVPLIIVVGFFHLTPTAQAADFTPEINIPGQFSGPQPSDGNLFGRYVRAIYVYFIWIVGIVATAMVVFAGVKWVAAAGDQGRIRDARDMINNAIIGVIIALTSVVLLNLLSPGFTTLRLPELTSVTKNYFTGAAATDLCSRQQAADCGQLKELGKTVVNPNGQAVPEYCMGTMCDQGSACALSIQTLPGYREKPTDFSVPFVIYQPDGGCMKKISLAPNQLPDYANTPSLTTIEILACGRVNSGDKLVGTDCGETLREKGICYIARLPAEVTDRPAGEQDTLRTMTCPI